MNTTSLHSRIAESFNRQRLLSTLGARLLRIADGEVVIELPWSEAIQQQQHGFIDAGAIAMRSTVPREIKGPGEAHNRRKWAGVHVGGETRANSSNRTRESVSD